MALLTQTGKEKKEMKKDESSWNENYRQTYRPKYIFILMIFSRFFILKNLRYYFASNKPSYHLIYNLGLKRLTSIIFN